MTITAPGEDRMLEQSPDRFDVCWVGRYYPPLCVDYIAEWLTKSADWDPQVDAWPPTQNGWNPTCTGCKDRFVQLNPRILVRRL